MLTIKIEDKEFESKLLEYVKFKKETIENITLIAINNLINCNENNPLNYTKQDPLKHLHKIQHKYDNDLCDEVALTHIEDSAAYIHELRRQKNQ